MAGSERTGLQSDVHVRLLFQAGRVICYHGTFKHNAKYRKLPQEAVLTPEVSNEDFVCNIFNTEQV